MTEKNIPVTDSSKAQNETTNGCGCSGNNDCGDECACHDDNAKGCGCEGSSDGGCG